MTSPKQINIGTRASRLAVAQAEMIRDMLQAASPDTKFEIHAINVAGDKNRSVPLPKAGSKDLWTHELEAMLLEGKLDLLVNCLKDMPTEIPDTCEIGAIVTRDDPRDVLIVSEKLPHATTLSTLPAGSVVGTSSLRRSAQLALRQPHLKFIDIRGNIDTRLGKLDATESPYTCIVLAAAGLNRMGWQARGSQLLDWGSGGIMYAVGQGALGLEIRKNDDAIRHLLIPLVDDGVSYACLAERSMLRSLEGGCSVPIGVETEWEGAIATEGVIHSTIGGHGLPKNGATDPKLKIRAIVVSLDGKQSVDTEGSAVVRNQHEAEQLGKKIASDLLDLGAGKILDEIKGQK